jgi:hypothetical protein
MTATDFALASVLLLVTVFNVSAQSRQGQYVVLTFEDTYKISQHGTDTYYWIISADSIKQRKNISPLLMRGFSKTTFDSCCKGEPINPFIVTATTSYDFAKPYFISIDTLRKLIFRHRKRIQVVSKKWQSGQEKLQVFVTPISGFFCTANYARAFGIMADYNGQIYIPISSFHYIDNFWKTLPIKLIERDFTEIYFSEFQNLSRNR